MTERTPSPEREGNSPADRPLALTMGDPGGIGLDITLASWARRETLGVPPFMLYADPEAMAQRAQALGITAALRQMEPLDDVASVFRSALPVRAITLPAPVVAGQPDAANASAVIASIEQAVEDVVAGLASAVVTNPIAKSVLYSVGFVHSGHTEFLAALAQRHQPGKTWFPVMMLASDVLRVVPLTVHIPLAAVPGALTRDRMLTTSRIVYEALRRDFGITRPRIAVAGLNPHAGEDGTIGREDADIIAPAIAELRAEGMIITGPISADSLFHAAARARYDAAIAMYHDQALIPIKTLAFETGVNATLGLPFVRTSPDHGTAFDIAGSGEASPLSLVAALKLAQTMARRRADHDA
ncbi:MAG: 4-hydroxythreonine-4-phosphate dehydrogenase PdxA [Hyphomicrobiaceae bacterium]